MSRIFNRSRDSYNKNKDKVIGFTIVELLVVIVVIGILAAITVVSYTGITKKAAETALQSNLTNAKKQLQLYQTEHGYYPTSINTSTGCPTPADTNYCIKANNNAFMEYSGTASTFALTATDTNNAISYKITESTTPTLVPTVDPDWAVIGTQTWAKTNLNVGVMIPGTTMQTNNGGNNIVEKYCYGNLESNCTTYGGLYQWDEAMKYTTASGPQGICETGSHIPTQAEWNILISFLGGSSAAYNKLIPGGSSFMNMPLAGYRFFIDGSFYGNNINGYYLTGDYVLGQVRFFGFYTPPSISTGLWPGNFGMSIRCMKNT